MLICEVGALAVGESVTATVTMEATVVGTVVNTAAIDNNLVDDTNPDNNEDSDDANVIELCVTELDPENDLYGKIHPYGDNHYNYDGTSEWKGVVENKSLTWFGLDATYLPNVFDFDNPPPEPDDFANTFRARLGLSDDDLIVLQPTRVVRRKAIEKGIELIRKLDDDRLIYLITGYEGDEKGGYGEWLNEEAERAGIRYRFIADVVGDYRDEEQGIYSLWDIYPHGNYSALGDWVNANGYHFTGSGREIFYQFPFPDREHEAIAEIQFPVEKITPKLPT